MDSKCKWSVAAIAWVNNDVARVYTWMWNYHAILYLIWMRLWFDCVTRSLILFDIHISFVQIFSLYHIFSFSLSFSLSLSFVLSLSRSTSQRIHIKYTSDNNPPSLIKLLNCSSVYLISSLVVINCSHWHSKFISKEQTNLNYGFTVIVCQPTILRNIMFAMLIFKQMTLDL